MKYNRGSLEDTARVGAYQAKKNGRTIYAVSTYFGMKLVWDKPARWQTYLIITPEGFVSENTEALSPGLISAKVAQ